MVDTPRLMTSLVKLHVPMYGSSDRLVQGLTVSASLTCTFIQSRLTGSPHQMTWPAVGRVCVGLEQHGIFVRRCVRFHSRATDYLRLVTTPARRAGGATITWLDPISAAQHRRQP